MRPTPLRLPLAVALALAAGAAVAELPELIPIEVLFDNPTQTQARISPDGSRISYLAPSEEGVLNVWVRPIEGGEATQVTQDDNRGISNHFWAEDGQRVMYLQDIAGNEQWHLYASDLETQVTRDLTPFLGIRAQNVIKDPGHADEILVGLNLRDRRVFDMYRVDLDTGAVVLDTQNPGDVQGWLTEDGSFEIRAAVAPSQEDGSVTLRVRDDAGSPWRDLIRWDFEESGSPVAFAGDGKSIYVESSLGSDTTRLQRIDLATGEVLEEIASSPKADVGSVEIKDDGNVIQAVEFQYLKPEWTVVDPAVAADFERLAAAHDGAFEVVSRTRDDRIWMVAFESDTGPVAYYLYRRPEGELEFLFTNRPELEKYTLAPMKPVVIQARDGLELVSYLTLPPGLEPEKLPMVLNVHGGPWGRDVWGYDGTAQWLANRGYAVLQVNFRGSAGFGKAFLNAGNKEWGQGAMQHDLTDAVRWAIDEGIADPEEIAIMGGSYGGYATLAGLTFTPELYACGVDIVGMSNMATTFATIPPWWSTFKQILVKRVGDAENDEEWNRRISPLFHADKIRAPLIIAQGANDPRVNINESNQIVEAMRANDQPVTYVVYPDEGHGFRRPENQLDFRYRADGFLADCLGGRSEPFQEVEGTTAQLR
ncbi:MAG: S9 family peptidase [Thermoanaerobaculia bacterium]|nr:S9 family peptidase [Thermoanaerobaculia bacterium]